MIEHDIKQTSNDTATQKQADRDELYKQALAFMAGDDGDEDYEPVDNYRYSLKYAYELFCQGEEGIWWCIGNFVNDFWVYFPLERQALIDEEIAIPEQATPEQRKWAVFFAASAEYLAHRYGLSVPPWSQKEAYKALDERWYFHNAALRLDDIREYDEQTTPEEYTRRNIICGGRVWYNKKERIA